MTHKGVLICTCIEVGAGASQHLLLYCPIWGDRSRVTSASQHVRESRFWNPRRFFLRRFRNLGNIFQWNLESWALKSGIKFKESEMPLMITIRNPSTTGNLESKQHWESKIQVPLGIRNPVNCFEFNTLHGTNSTLDQDSKFSSIAALQSFTCQKICFL